MATSKSKEKKKPARQEGLTFDMYCTQKKIPGRRRPGMRAYTKLIRASLEEWEKVFASY